MDATIVIVLAVFLLTGLGAGVVVMSGRAALPGGFAFAGGRMRRATAPSAISDQDMGSVLPDPGLSLVEAIDAPVTPALRGRSFGLPEPPTAAVSPEAVTSAIEAVSRRLDLIEERLATAERARYDDGAALRRAIAGDTMTAAESVRAALLSEIAALGARHEAALGRLRADLTPAGERLAGDDAIDRMRKRRADSAAELYARVARLESALAQVTNPVLLPGEPYAPPAEFLAEALAWENWKDVGERAFALADGFSAQRLFLSDHASREVAAFVTTLRGVLTRVVYPNLAVDASTEQTDALRGALIGLAADLPAVRHALEVEYRSAAGVGASGGADREREQRNAG